MYVKINYYHWRDYGLNQERNSSFTPSFSLFRVETEFGQAAKQETARARSWKHPTKSLI